MSTTFIEVHVSVYWTLVSVRDCQCKNCIIIYVLVLLWMFLNDIATCTWMFLNDIDTCTWMFIYVSEWYCHLCWIWFCKSLDYIFPLDHTTKYDGWLEAGDHVLTLLRCRFSSHRLQGFQRCMSPVAGRPRQDNTKRRRRRQEEGRDGAWNRRETGRDAEWNRPRWRRREAGHDGTWNRLATIPCGPSFLILPSLKYQTIGDVLCFYLAYLLPSC